MNKESLKKSIVPGLIYVTGMLSVSIANIFGRHYGFVCAIIIILSAIYLYNLFDQELQIKKNIVNLSLISFLLLSELLFFIVNDIFNVIVYSKGYTGFWGVLVIISQVLSVAGLIYLLINLVIENKNTSIEVIEHELETLGVNNEEKEDDEESAVVADEKENVRFISTVNVNSKTPFMEEEK